APIALTAVAADRSTGTAWALSSDRLIAAEPSGAATAYVAPAELAGSSSAAITVDALGDLWIALGPALHHLSRGATAAWVGFASDVARWIGAHCTQCHGNQTQDFRIYEVFAPKAEEALGRIRSGDMPRCNGGLVCPADQHLAASDYAVLEQWIRAGKPR